jgi:2-oxoglutarate dehydrogenase E2 component (dihydrolipoamide succinyltransferase)
MAHNLLMPRLSQEMDEGTISEWLKREGEPVAEGDPIVTIESDKAEVELPSPGSGIVRAIRFPVGATVQVGTVLAVIADADEEIEAEPSGAATTPVGPAGVSTGPGGAGSADPGSSTPPTVATPPARGTPVPGGRVPASPAARRAAAEAGIDIERVTGTGPDGLVTDTDVRVFAAAVSPTTQREEVEVIPLTGRRRRAAERLVLSRQTAADVTTILDVDVSEIAAARKGSGASYTAYVAWAAAQSLLEFPILNASLLGEEIHVWKGVDLGVAVALDHGLVVPVIRGAEAKTVEQISGEVDAAAARARDGDVMPSELTGGTFTVTNSGSLGSLMFTPIINQPEVAILGMGKVADTPVVRDGEVVVRQVMYLCLSYDHRVVEGADAVRFLGAVKRRLEQIGA